MIGTPKRTWLLRSLLGVIFAVLAWTSFPWFHDPRLLWSIHQPLATLASNATPAVICSDPYGRWVFLKHRPKDKVKIVCTALRQDTGKILYENIGEDQKDKYDPLTHNNINQPGELIYSVLKYGDSKVAKTSTTTEELLGWCIVKAWNLNDGSHSEKLRVPMPLFGWAKLSSDGNTLIAYSQKGIANNLDVEVWSTNDGQSLRRFTIANANLDDNPILISNDCRWLILGKGDADSFRAPHDYYPRFSFDIAVEDKYQRLDPIGVLRKERSLRVIDLEHGIETEEIKGLLSRALDITLQGDLVVLNLLGPLQQRRENYFYIDLASPDRALKPYRRIPNQDRSNYGLVTSISYNHWIEEDSTSEARNFTTIKLRRVDVTAGQGKEHPYFHFPNTRQASPLGESLMIVNHGQPILIPDWLEPWLTKYDLTNYWPWKACKRMVICEADTGKVVWQKRFPADGYLQADIAHDQSKLFVLYWKNDQLELYAYSLDFSLWSYWKQSCAALAVLVFALLFRWPKRKKADSAPVQQSA